MKRIIINADDFGYTAGCNEGIIKCMREGIVTSTTVMMNMPCAAEGIELAKSSGIEYMGVHLNLTKGRPLCDGSSVISLVGEDGNFKPIEDIIANGCSEEIKLEFRAQIEEFLKTGLGLTHLDSHHHIHSKARIYEICIGLSKEYRVPMRRMLDRSDCAERYIQTDSFSTEFYGESATEETIKRIISEAPEGTTEIMCHPGYVDEELKTKSSYSEQRLLELKVLTSPDLKRWIADQGATLVSYKNRV